MQSDHDLARAVFNRLMDVGGACLQAKSPVESRVNSLLQLHYSVAEWIDLSDAPRCIRIVRNERREGCPWNGPAWQPNPKKPCR